MQGVHLRKYGVQTTINFELYEVDGVDFRTDAVHVAGDSKIMKDEGAEANTTNGFTDEGQGYSIVLTATEMQAARIVLYIVDSATKVWLDKCIVIETYGNASAMHAFDLGTAMASQTVGTASALTTNNDKTGYALSAAGNTAVIDEFETQSQADPTGFHVNVKEVNGTAQTANDNSADINDIKGVVEHADYGNAKLVRSTTPANTLDVSATGEAGLDFDNIKDATGAHTLTNITVPTVTDITNEVSADVTKVDGSAQKATDLGDLALDGYDPATDQIEGVKLTDTTTAVTGTVTATINPAVLVSL